AAPPGLTGAGSNPPLPFPHDVPETPCRYFRRPSALGARLWKNSVSRSPQGSPMTDICLYLGIGLVVGLVSGALGIGGGVLMLPALIWLCDLSPAKAAGTTLAVLVVPVVLPAAWDYYARGNVDVKAAVFIALAFAAGGYGGAALRNRHLIPEEVFRLGLGLIMMYIAFNLIVTSDSEATKAAGGITAAGLAWLAYLGLHVLGRRALERPRLQDQIRRMDEQGYGGPDYHI